MSRTIARLAAARDRPTTAHVSPVVAHAAPGDEGAMQRRLASLLVLCGATFGCTGKAQTNDPRVCPVGLPSDDAGCAVEGLHCTYGAACGQSAQCIGRAWRASSDGCGDAAPVCPSTTPRSGVSCSGGLLCSYACGDGGTVVAACASNGWSLTASGCALPGS